MCRQSSLDIRLFGAGLRNSEELKLHTHGYSHEQMKMKKAVWKFEVGSSKFEISGPAPLSHFTLLTSNFQSRVLFERATLGFRSWIGKYDQRSYRSDNSMLYPLSYKASQRFALAGFEPVTVA